MANPLQTVLGYLRGDDLKTAARPPGEEKSSSTPPVTLNDVGASMWTGPYGFASYDSSSTGSDANSAVFACLMALSLGHIEPPLKVLQRTANEDTPKWLSESPWQQLLDDPNPTHDNLELWFWTQWARNCDGNAYLRKIRSGDELTGNVTELWPISPSLIRPYTAPGSSNFIDYYEYFPRVGKPPERIPPENIVHFRIGIDDADMRLGISPIKRLVREISSDDEATKFADALLKNFGIPGLVVTTPENGPTLTEEQALELKSRIATSFGNGNRGNVGVLTAGAGIEQMGFSPEQLNLEVLHGVPETRICAVMGVHPAIAAMTVGLKQTANFASLKAVYEAFTERKLVPTWAMDASKLNKQLRPDFTPDRTVYVQHDLTRVRSLQEDEDAKYKRLDTAVAGFWIKPSEARVAVGYPEDPQLDALWLARAMLGGAGPAPAAKARALRRLKDLSDIQDFPAIFASMIDAAEPELEGELAAYFDGARRRVNRALLSG